MDPRRPPTHKHLVRRVSIVTTSAALPLTHEHRDVLPSLVAQFCDLEALIHEETQWKPFTPTLLVQGYEPQQRLSFPIKPADRDLIAFMDRFADHVRGTPPPMPPEAIVLVVVVRLPQPDVDAARARLLVGVLGNGDVFTICRLGEDTPLLTWGAHSDDLPSVAQPYIDPIVDLLDACRAHP